MTLPMPSDSRPFGRLQDRWMDLRDTLLASPKFHRFAASMPFTRPLARKRARDLFDLCAGFVYSQVLLSCVRLDLFTMLADTPLTAPEIALRTNLSLDSTDRLLTAAVSLRLLAIRKGNRYGLGDLGAAIRGAPGVAEMVEHHAMLYRDLTDPVALLKDRGKPTETGAYWAYTKGNGDNPGAVPEDVSSPYTALMSASQPFVAEEVLDAYPVRRHRRLMDVGGGDGTFLRAAAARDPSLELTLFDLPSVASQAEKRFEEEGLSARSTAIGGSFFDDDLPKGADLISLVRVLYDHDDDAALRILKAVRKAMPADGTLLLAEPMSGTAGAEPIGEAYFGFYLLAMRSGRPRSPAIIEGLLKKAGFTDIKLLKTNRPLLARAMTARPSNTFG